MGMRIPKSSVAHRLAIPVVVIALLASAPTANAAIRMTLVRAAHCAADCPLDTLRRGVFEISTSRKRGSYGIEGRLRVKGAMKDGKPVDLGNLTAILPLRRGDVGCNPYYLRGIQIVGGATSLDFFGDDIYGPDIDASQPAPAGTAITLCGEIRIVPDDTIFVEYKPILVGGFVLGEASRDALRMDLVPDPSCGGDCPITGVSKARVEMGGRSSKGQVELVAKIDLQGARHGGTKVDLDGLAFFFGLRPGDLNSCLAAMVPDVMIAGGRATRRAAGAEVMVTWPQKEGKTFSYCVHGFVGPADPEEFEVPWLSIGFVVGDDPAR
jgi:hypothetical protein